MCPLFDKMAAHKQKSVAKMITSTSLNNPVMLAKVRRAMLLARMGYGHLMGGHGHRCYIQNRKGNNVLRLDFRNGEYIIYGSESRLITDKVGKALADNPKHCYKVN